MEDYIECNSLEQVARRLFNSDPAAANSFRLISSETGDEATGFEMLITLFMEAVALRLGLDESTDLSTVDSDLLYKQLVELEPWFKSLGYHVSVARSTYLGDMPMEMQFADRYCKIMIRTPLTDNYFKTRNISKNYTFLLNPQFAGNGKPIAKYYGIFRLDNFIYKINFSPL